MLTEAHDESVLDARAHLDRLLHPAWISTAGFDRLPDIARYLRALEHRVRKARTQPDRDRRHIATIQALEREYRDVARRDLDGSVRAMLEELRVQHLRPVRRRQGRRQRAQGASRGHAAIATLDVII